MNCLELVDVSYRYDGSAKPVLNQINAAFESGKVYTIIGESGAGKSTLLSLISGLDICREGDVYYDGKNLRELDRDDYRAKSIGVIFQGYNLLTNSTAVYNITLSMNISESEIKDRQTKKETAYLQHFLRGTASWGHVLNELVPLNIFLKGVQNKWPPHG